MFSPAGHGALRFKFRVSGTDNPRESEPSVVNTVARVLSFRSGRLFGFDNPADNRKAILRFPVLPATPKR